MSGVKLFGYRIPTKQVVGGLVFWLIIGVVLWSTRKMPMFEDGAPGPRFMPTVLAALFSILAICYWIEAATKEAIDKASDDERDFGRPLLFFAICVLLALCWQPLGALLTVFICSLVELRFIERFNWRRTLVASAVISAIALVLFQIVLGVALPGGVFESLSYLRL